MSRVRWALTALVVGLVVFAGSSADALEPASTKQLKQYRADGTLDVRIARAKALGNQDVDPSLAKSAIARMRAAAGAYSLPAPPPAWQGGLATSGAPRVLAVCIDFSDYPSTLATSAIVAGLAGAQNPSSSQYPYESLKAYYQRSSYGKLDLQPELLGRYRASVPRSAIMTSSVGRENLIAEALRYYDARGTDFRRYDNNSDGVIDYLMVFWSGPDDGWSNFWWGYQTSWYATSLTIDGVRPSDYSWQWESNPVGSSFRSQTVIHETGHALGLPDYYDYDDTLGADGGVGDYDMMDGTIGDHNAFSKWMLEWITPSVVTTASTAAQLRSSGTYPDALVVMPGASASNPFMEMFVVQNRQYAGNDAGFEDYGSSWNGVNVWHVDARLSGGNFAWNNSYTDHKLLALEQADGLGEIENGAQVDSSDFWRPGLAFRPSTTPSSARYDGSASGVNVDSITMSGQDVTLRAYIQGTADIDAPVTQATVPAGWQRSDVGVKLSAVDGVSGIAATYLNVDGGGWQPGVATTITAPADGTNNGVHTVSYYSVDGAGNIEPKRSSLVKVDCTAPSSWHGTPARSGTISRLALYASDSHSGVAGIRWRVDGSTWSTGTSAAFSSVGTHTVEYLAVDLAGNVEAVHRVDVAAVPLVGSTGIRMSDSSLVVPYGAGTVTGEVLVGNTGASGLTVILDSSKDAVTWSLATSTTVTSDQGRFTFAIKPVSRTYYRVRYLGPQYSAATGFTIPITPKAYLTRPYCGTTQRAGRSFSASGYLKPRHTSGTSAVKIKAYRYKNGKYVYYKSFAAKASDYSTYTKYKGSVKLPYRGKWRLRAYHADTKHAATYTTYRYVTVK